MQNVISTASEIFERLKEALGLKNDADLARELGVPPKKLAVWKLRNTLPLEEVTTFCVNYGYNLEAALTGKGSMQRDTEYGCLGGELYCPVVMERRQDYQSEAVRDLIHLVNDLDDEGRKDVLRYARERKLLAELAKTLPK